MIRDYSWGGGMNLREPCKVLAATILANDQYFSGLSGNLLQNTDASYNCYMVSSRTLKNAGPAKDRDTIKLNSLFILCMLTVVVLKPATAVKALFARSRINTSVMVRKVLFGNVASVASSFKALRSVPKSWTMRDRLFPSDVFPPVSV